MKIVYYSHLPFADCDYPLIKAFRDAGQDVSYYIPILKDKLNGPLVSISEQIKRSGIFPASEYPEFRKYDNFLPSECVNVVNRTAKGGHPRNVFLYFKLAFKLLRERPDVVHITTPLSGPELPLYLLRRRMVLTVHDPFPHTGEISKRKERQRRRAFKLVNKIIVLNELQKDAFIQTYHIRKPVLTGRLGVYDTLRSIEPSPGREGPYILHFGRISPYKGIEYLCQAMPIVHRTLPDLKCIIAGSGPRYFDSSIYDSLPYIDFIHEYIPTETLAGLIGGALFCVCPYTDATQSGVVASSFALGKPVLATEVGALAETVEDRVTGRLIPPKDVEALAAAIIEMASSPSELSLMSQAIDQRFRTGEWSWDAIARKYLSFYE